MPSSRGKILGVVAVTIIAGGCTKVGPDFVKPEAPQAETWIEEDDTRVKLEEADYSQWWTVFDDAVLTDLVNLAAAQNLDLQVAGLRILESRAALGVAIGQQFPQQQDLTAAYSRTKLAKNAPNTADPVDRNFDDLSFGLDAAWELDFWGKFRRGIESVDASLAADVASYDDFLVTLTADVASTYAFIREIQERLKLARNNVALQQRTLEIAEARFKAGAVTELDVQQALSFLRETESRIPVLEAQLRQAQNALSVLLGIPPQDLIEEIGGVKPIPTADAEVALGIPADLLRRRPDIREAEFEAAAQSARIGVARAELFPAFSIAGFVGLQTSDAGGRTSRNANIDDLFEANSLTGFINPQVRWPILNYGRLTNNVRVEDARFQQSVVDYQNTVLEAYQEVEDALVAFLRSQEQAGFLDGSVKASERSVELALLQYREGIADYQRVLDTQRDLVGRQDDLAATQGSIARNLIATYRALGGGWETRTDAQFVPEETLLEMQERTNWGDLVPPKDIPIEPPPEDDALIPVRWPDW